MEIKVIIDEIRKIIEEVKRRYNSYCYDIDFTNLIDRTLTAKLKLLLIFMKNNNLTTYIDVLEIYLPVENNAEEVIEFISPILDEIMVYAEWNDPIKKEGIIREIAFEMQSNYTITSIDVIFKSLGISCGKEFYTTNSKRIYVQNVLANVDTVKIIDLAKKLRIISDTIKMDEALVKLSNDFIEEQINKCNQKINSGDFDGAITNSRSLIEEILLEIEEKIVGSRQSYDGKIEGLYKRVRKIMNMDPNPEINNSINSILTGFISIISGMSNITNKMGDRHAVQYKADKRHAMLIVNFALTISKFLIESYDYQKSK